MAKRKRFENFAINQPDEFVRFILQDFFSKEGFTYKEVKGEYLWEKGQSLMAGPQYIKVDYLNGVIYLEAWVKSDFLTSDGGFIVRNMFKNTVDELIQLLQQPVNQPAYATNVTPQQCFDPSGSGYGNASFQQPIPVATHDPTSKATAALVLGICSFIGIRFLVIGIILAGFGISLAKQGMKSSARGRAVAGLVLCITFFAFTILAFVIGFLSAII